MKPKLSSVSGVLCLVEDLDKTIDFYDKVGLDFRQREETYATGYVNWFWVEFVQNDSAEDKVFKATSDLKGNSPGAGVFLHLSVEDVDAYYEYLQKEGLKPSSEPRDFPWGRREFVIRDPDGYKIVFFKKIKK
jgi:catechol 2,3-dioxygenase-like lactoylglutathione lyase family enzyme